MSTIVDQQVSISIEDEGIRGGFEEDEVTSGSKAVPFSRFGDPGLRLESDTTENKMVTKSFLCSLGAFKTRTKVADVYKCGDGEMNLARRKGFRIYMEAVARKRGDANVMQGWYGGSRDQIGAIASHGFGSPVQGGVCISAAKHSVDAVMGAELDEGGLRHVLMCRVILGNQEQVRIGSDQCYPSSKKFDTGVDCLNEPRKYIVWSAYCNAYILPIYVVSFKIDPLPQGLGSLKGIISGRMRPSSAWVKFSNLVTLLGRILPTSQMAQIEKCYKDFSEKKIARQEMIFKLRLIAGDKLLAATIKNFRGRH